MSSLGRVPRTGSSVWVSGVTLVSSRWGSDPLCPTLDKIWPELSSGSSEVLNFRKEPKNGFGSHPELLWMIMADFHKLPTTLKNLPFQYLPSSDLQGIYLEVVPCNSLQTCFSLAGNSLISTLIKKHGTWKSTVCCRVSLVLHIRKISNKRSKHMLFSPAGFSSRYMASSSRTSALLNLCKTWTEPQLCKMKEYSI